MRNVQLEQQQKTKSKLENVENVSLKNATQTRQIVILLKPALEHLHAKLNNETVFNLQLEQCLNRSLECQKNSIIIESLISIKLLILTMANEMPHSNLKTTILHVDSK